jgi:uncharacterized protein with PIN domain
LNLGDCFAYACAKPRRAKRLFKGDDFTMTDYYCSLTNLLWGANAWT